jgi:hypothetical protein
MSIIRNKKTIDKSQIQIGQVLELQYIDKKGKSSTNLILVVDPKATTVATTGAGPKGIGQGRVGTLHAIKLKDLSDPQLLILLKEVHITKNQGNQMVRTKYENSEYSQGLSNYRTYLHDGITTVSRVTLAQPAPSTHKEKIENSILYGCTHETYVHLLEKDYETFLDELRLVNGQIYYEGPQPPPKGDWPIIDELLMLTKSNYTGRQPLALSWEPTEDEFKKLVELHKKDSILANLGGKLSGWWGQWIDGDETPTSAINNLLGAWPSDDIKFELTIGAAFEKSVGSWKSVRSRWEEYKYEGRTYTTTYIENLLNEKGWENNTPTLALRRFNEAGHFQLFPDDSTWNKKTNKFEGDYTEGKLFPAQDIYNEIRDRHLINKMTTNPGIYFAGAGHVDNVRKLRPR